MTNTNVSIVNASLEQIGAQSQITALNDGSLEANAATVVYPVAVQLLLRQLDPDFARTRVALTTGTVTTPNPWSNVYVYPATCLRVRQIVPVIGSYNVFDPQPIRGEVYFDPVNGKLILTNIANAVAVFTTSAVTEASFDSAFVESLIMMLGNPLSMAIAGRPDFAKTLLEDASQFSQIAELSEEL